MSKTESNAATATAPVRRRARRSRSRTRAPGPGTTVPILEQGTEGDTAIRAMDLRQIKRAPDDFGLMTYDPAFMNTASCQSAITFIDGDKGILRYRGYPIEQLAEKATLPRGGVAAAQRRAAERRSEYDQWVHDITYHTYVHENIKKFLEGFRYDAHPMSMLCSAVAALSSFYPRSEEHPRPERSATSRSSACSPRCRRSRRSATAT